jgi:hypothetical protein
MAGLEWIYSFVKQYPRHVIRKEETVSINRALGINKFKVGGFF